MNFYRGFLPEVSALLVYDDQHHENDTRITCTLAETPQDRDEVYRLRYGCYRRDEAIEPRNDERFSDLMMFRLTISVSWRARVGLIFARSDQRATAGSGG